MRTRTPAAQAQEAQEAQEQWPGLIHRDSSRLAGHTEDYSKLDLYKLLLKDEFVHAFDVLGDPVRRRLLELMAEGEQPAGALAARVSDEFGITQPGVSQHLRVLREHGFATVRPEGTKRLYAVRADSLREVDDWLDRFRAFWEPHLDALHTEIARGKRARRDDEGEP